MSKKDKFLKDIDFLIDLSNQTNKSYLANKLHSLKLDFYDVLGEELSEQHKTYIKLVKTI